MKTELIVHGEHRVPPGSALEKSEHELAEAMAEQFEAFYRQGCILEGISKRQEYKDANYDSFRDYIDDRQPVGVNGRYAHRLIAAKNVRELLPNLEGPNGPSMWTEGNVRPLTHKEFSKSDVRRIGKKIATQVRKGVPLSEKLVKTICEDDRGVPRQKARKAKEKLDKTDTPADVLKRLRVEAKMWQSSLAKVPEDFWSDADAEDSGCLDRTIAALSELVSFLSS